ncbi:phosphoglycerate mutase 2-like [Lycorma delicatula]|uniref:phosphoglycerate mutase 2-like n=1 Tax=Lycorma delicatula TaxID=130591 RepID=UPI003F50F04A
MAFSTVVLVRHGESEWTKKNLFCGWYNAPLTDKGVLDAIGAGQVLKEAEIKFDIAFTSQLMRANKTLELILKEIDQPDLPVVKSWKLNERHYGALTGMNKEEAVEKYGSKQVQIWRRSFDVPSPPMDKTHAYYNSIKEYAKSVINLKSFDVPKVETLKMTMQRVIPYWLQHIVPEIKLRKRVLVVCHGTCLRAIQKHIDDISDEDIMNTNVPIAIPTLYELGNDIKPLKPIKYLSDEETIRKGIEKAASVKFID